MTAELLLAGIPGIATALFLWLWRRAKRAVTTAEKVATLLESELTLTRKTADTLRGLVEKRNQELKECREKLPPAQSLDDFFSGLPKGDPNQNDN